MSAHRRVGLCTVAVLAGLVVSCADGDDSEPSADAADTFLRAAADDGLVVDETCVDDLADQLSESDARAVIEAGPDGTPEDLSDQGVAIVDRLLTCADRAALADVIIADLEELGSDVDGDCVRDVVEQLDLDAVFAGGGDDELFEAVVPCAE